MVWLYDSLFPEVASYFLKSDVSHSPSHFYLDLLFPVSHSNELLKLSGIVGTINFVVSSSEVRVA